MEGLLGGGDQSCAYKALGCDSGEVGAPTKKLQPARDMNLEARATPLSVCRGLAWAETSETWGETDGWRSLRHGR